MARQPKKTPLNKNGVPTDLGRELTKGYAGRRIRHRAFQVSCCRGFSESDRDDLEQDLRIAIMQSLHMFDPSRGHWNVFVFTIVEREILDRFTPGQIRERTRAMETDSLSTLVAGPDQEETSLAQLVLPEDLSRLNGQPHRHHTATTDLTEDVAVVIDHLPPEQATLAMQLMELSPSELARELKVPRSTLRDAIKELRESFMRWGVDGEGVCIPRRHDL